MRNTIVWLLSLVVFGVSSLSIYAMEKKGKKETPPPSNEFIMALKKGIDFSDPALPAIVKSVTGISGAEANGRWTDGGKVTITFTQKLPKSFKLHIESKGAFGPNVNKPIQVIIGKWKGSIIINNEKIKPFDLVVKTVTPVDTIEFIVPEPKSPEELKISNDPRKLGFWMTKLSIE
ncbi:DUF7024 domain-containing protein [Desulfatirhabdium butyrativorans]|uniref:DUF7024 domain-containing protein n=1 Tax=Desulfatirhabdium butyrativorans TaxID=340467 RepID=UPI0004804E3F|nr:hypothetical protein [Desulfatirhabdium butyrativorans]